MTRNEVETRSIHNPFNDELEECICTMELQFQDNNQFVGGNLTHIITSAGCDLIEYFNEEKKEEIEQEILEELEL